MGQAIVMGIPSKLTGSLIGGRPGAQDLLYIGPQCTRPSIRVAPLPRKARLFRCRFRYPREGVETRDTKCGEDGEEYVGGLLEVVKIPSILAE